MQNVSGCGVRTDGIFPTVAFHIKGDGHKTQFAILAIIPQRILHSPKEVITIWHPCCPESNEGVVFGRGPKFDTFPVFVGEGEIGQGLVDLSCGSCFELTLNVEQLVMMMMITSVNLILN